MKKKASNKTAAEFMAELQRDQKYQEMIYEKEKKRKELELQLSIDEKKLIDELISVGVTVSSVWDLVNTKESYPAAIPVLIKHLSKNYHYKNKEGIVRALSVREAIGKATPVLIEEYNRTPKELTSYRWAIGNSVFTTITSSDVEDVLRIVRDKSNGESRHMFILALNKVRSEKVDQVLRDLLNDKEVSTYAAEALSKLKAKK
jgi:hypothetical protein